MNTSTIFKTFNYTVLPAASMPGNTQDPDEKTTLVKLDIDFEKENFALEADWQYIMQLNKYAEKTWFDCHQQQVTIKASIFPGVAIDLSDENNDGLVFMIEGIIKDKDGTGICSGLLVLDKTTADNKTGDNKWNISCYLYDNGHDNCEIAFRLPVNHPGKNNILN